MSGEAIDVSDGSEPPESTTGITTGPVELGLYSVDELAALAPGRIDPLSGDDPDVAAGARSLVAGGRMQFSAGNGDTLVGAPVEPAAVVGLFLSDPERTVVVRIDDLFGTDQYALHGRTVDDELCYVLEGGTRGVRRLVFVRSEDAPSVVAALSGLDSLGDIAGGSAPVDEIDVRTDAPAESSLGAALAHPTHSVTVSSGRPGVASKDVSFVTGDDAAWLVEWTGEHTARVSPLDEPAVMAALAQLLT